MANSHRNKSTFLNKIVREIYEIVLNINREVQKEVKAGVSWGSLEALCYKLLLKGLVKLGILKGEVDDLFKKFVYILFMPHSLGHLLVPLIESI